MMRILKYPFAALQRIDRQLPGAKAARLQVWLFLTPLFTLFTTLSFENSVTFSALEVAGIAIANQAIGFVMYATTRGIVVRRAGSHSTLILFAWYVLFTIPGEVFKAFALGLTGEWRAEQPVVWLSVPTSALVAAIWVVLSNLSVNWFAAARIALGELRANEGRLGQTRTKLSEQLTTELQQLRAQVEASILPTIEKLRVRVAGNANAADASLLQSASEIRDFCDSEVRTLSHQIAQQKSETQATAPGSRIGFVEALLTTVRNGDISLNQLFGIMLTLAVPYALDSAGYRALLVTVLGLTLGYLLLRLIDPIRRRVFGNSGAKSFVSALVMYLGVSALGLSILQAGLPLYENLRDFVQDLTWLLPGMLILIWLILGFVFGANDVLHLAIEKTRSTSAQIATENSRLLALGSATRNRVYRLLHGSIQGRLAAVSLALTAIVGEADLAKREELLGQAVEQMRLAEADLRGAFDQKSDSLPFAASLASLGQSWRNLISIELTAQAEAIAKLDESEFLKDEVLGALQEGITNAHRHAQATKVEIAIVLGENEIEMRVKNDARAEANDAADGTGIERIALGASSVKFDRGQDFATLTATWKIVS